MCNEWKLWDWLAAEYNWEYKRLAGSTGYNELLQLLLGYVVGVMFWCRGKLALLTWFTPKLDWERRSSWTGLSAALELSDKDLGPEMENSAWFVEYLGTRRDEACVVLCEWLVWVCEETSPKCWSKSVVVSGKTAR